MILAIQTAISLFSVIFAWSILSLPFARDYVLQIFALMIIVFIVLKKISKKDTPNYKSQLEKSNLQQNLQIAPLGIAVFLLLGETGGFSSWLLPLFFVYLFFLAFSSKIPAIVIAFIGAIGFLYTFTSDFGAANYGAILSLIVFLPVAIFAQKYYAQAIKESNELQLEREKVAYYNLYAEKQQSQLLARSENLPINQDNLADFVANLIPKIDDLQKESRFPQNQLVISAQLTKIGLSLRQALKKNL